MKLHNFARMMEARPKRLAEKLSRTSVVLAQMLVDELVSVTPEGTPVDTSKALSNWQITLDSPNASEIDAHFPGSKKSTYTQSAEATRQAAKVVLKSKKAGQKLYVSNAAPYIHDLNYNGTSKQSPMFFVNEAVEKVRLMAPLVYRGIKNVR